MLISHSVVSLFGGSLRYSFQSAAGAKSVLTATVAAAPVADLDDRRRSRYVLAFRYFVVVRRSSPLYRLAGSRNNYTDKQIRRREIN